jgi:Zn-finger nucleic acid-binding protein
MLADLFVEYDAAMWPCPACGTALVRAHPSHGVFVCQACGGVFADLAASTALRAAAEPAIVAVSEAASHQARIAVAADAPGRVCPACRTPLGRAVIAGVSIDYCATHGTFFDRGEIVRIVSAARAERAREAEPTAGEVAGGVIEFWLELLGGLA